MRSISGYTPPPYVELRHEFIDRDPAAGMTRTAMVGWCSPTHGRRADEIVLRRPPSSEAERVWVEDVLPTRVRPGGRIRTRQGDVLFVCPSSVAQNV